MTFEDPFQMTHGRQMLMDQFGPGSDGTPAPFLLRPEVVMELLTSPPAAVRGRCAALSKQMAVARSVGRETPHRELLEWLMGIEAPAPALVEQYEHPMDLRGRRVEQTGLSSSDVAFLDSLRYRPPAEVSDEDARLLAHLELQAASAPEQRLVGQVAEPVRLHHDRLAESAELRQQIASASAVLHVGQVSTHQMAAGALPGGPAPARPGPDPLARATKHLAAALAGARRAELDQELAAIEDFNPKLRDEILKDAERVAQAEAHRQLSATWKAANEVQQATVVALNARLEGVTDGTLAPRSSKPDVAVVSSAYEAGAARARRDAETRPMTLPDPRDVAVDDALASAKPLAGVNQVHVIEERRAMAAEGSALIDVLIGAAGSGTSEALDAEQGLA